MPQIAEADVSTGCLQCGQAHEHANNVGAPQPNLCNVCQVCWLYCEHTAFCRWPAGKETVKATTVSVQTAGVAKAVDSVASLNLKEAFESWLVSTQLFVENMVDPSAAWQEFEMFVNEILTPVDKTKRYVLMEVDPEENISGFKFIKGDLYTNQGGEFVQVEGKKRVRLGKNIAIM